MTATMFVAPFGSTPRKRMVLGVFATLVGLVALRAMWPSTAPVPDAAMMIDTTSLTIDVATEIPAGAPIPISLRGAEPDVPVDIVVASTSGPHRVQVDGADPLSLEVPGWDDVASSGEALITATQRNRVATATTRIVPGDPASPLDVYVGPHSTIAGEQRAQVVTSITDRRGNPVVSGSPVEVAVIGEDDEPTTTSVETDGLLARADAPPQTRAGIRSVSITSANARSPERDFLVSAGAPTPFTISVEEPLPYADGRTLYRITTSRLVDRYDNPMPDGAAVRLDFEGEIGRRQVPSDVVDGAAEFIVEAPPKPGSAQVWATVAGVSSEPITVTFEPAIESIPVSFVDQGDVTRILVGPVDMRSGGFVPDSTTATIRVGERSYTRPTYLGAAEIEVPTRVLDAADGSVTVGVLGVNANATDR